MGGILKPLESIAAFVIAMSLQRLVLVLNGSYEPCNVVTARRAFTLITKGAATVEAVSGYTIRAGRMTLDVPAVIRLTRYRRIPRQNRSVSRKGILLRDANTCQYCGQQAMAKHLTLDHVMPRSRGGQNTWENLVSSCFACNNKKRDRTPAEAGMVLLRQPRQITIHSKHKLLAGADNPIWERFLFA